MTATRLARDCMIERPFPAYRGDGPYIFVSYSHGDKEVVFPALQWLRDQGFNIWYDEGISPGASWREELAESILRCDLFIILISPQSVSSENCFKELNFALDNDRSVLAIHLEQTNLSPGLALALNDRQAIFRHELSDEEYREKVLGGVTTYIEPAQASPANIRPVTVSTKGKRTLVTATGFIALIVVVVGFFAFFPFDQEQEITSAQPPELDVGVIDTGSEPPVKVRSNWIAVLPFSTLSESSEASTLARGLTTQVVDALGPISWFSVVPYRAVEKFSDRTLSLEEIARSLNVRYLVDGRIQHTGNKIRVSIGLIDGILGQSLWQETRTFEAADLLAIQDEMTLITTRVLSSRFMTFEQQRLSSISKQHMDADDLHILASYFWLDPNHENLEIAISDLRRALVISPSHAPAIATLAHLLTQYSYTSGADPEATRKEVCELTSRAMLLGRGAEQAIASVGYALTDLCRESAVALKMIERAIRENPENAVTWATHGSILITNGEIEAGFAALEKAEQLDPESVWVRYLTDAFRAQAYMRADDWETGVRIAQKAVDADPSLFWLQIPLANGLGILGNYDGARKQWQLVKARFPRLSVERYRWYMSHAVAPGIVDRQIEGLTRAGVEQ